jgi:hypothetical protein
MLKNTPQVKIKKGQINIHLCMFKPSSFAPKHYKKIKSQNTTLTFKACLLCNLEDYTKTSQKLKPKGARAMRATKLKFS